MEAYHNQMSFHTLLDSLSKNQNGFVFLSIFYLIFAGTSVCFAQEEPTITLATNKDYYIPGDTVQLSGIITGQPNTLVALQVKDSDGNLILIRTIQADQNGNFAMQFKLPLSAASGKFSITASTKVNGFVVTQTKVFDAKVPEFPFAVPVMLASFISVLVLYRVGFRKL